MNLFEIAKKSSVENKGSEGKTFSDFLTELELKPAKGKIEMDEFNRKRSAINEVRNSSNPKEKLKEILIYH